jgi:hypothetical protein
MMMKLSTLRIVSFLAAALGALAGLAWHSLRPTQAAATNYPLFVVQPGTPAALPNFVTPANGCNWMGVGGQVFNSAGAPLNGLVVEISGTLGAAPVYHLTLTGNSPAIGPGGFLVTLGSQPVSSLNTLHIQVLNLNAAPQTDLIYFTTYNSCDRNMILLNFRQLSSGTLYRSYLPGLNYDIP